MGGGLENRCVGRVYGADGARHHPHRTHDPRSSSLPCCIKLAFHIISAELISISKYRTFNHRRRIVARHLGMLKTTF